MAKVENLDKAYIKECFALLDSLSETEVVKVTSLLGFAIEYFQGYNQGRPVGDTMNRVMAHNLECWTVAVSRWQIENKTTLQEVCNRMFPESEQSVYDKRILARMDEEYRQHPINMKKNE